METLRLPATMESLETFRQFVLDRLQPLSTLEELVFKVELVLEEALTNVIHYAYPEAAGEVEVGIVIEADQRFCFCVKDWGIPFNPLERPDPEYERRGVGTTGGGTGRLLYPPPGRRSGLSMAERGKHSDFLLSSPTSGEGRMIRSITTKMLLLVFGILITTALVLMFFAREDLEEKFLETEANSVRNVIYLVKLNIENQYGSLLFHKLATLEKRKSEMKKLTTLVVSVLDRFPPLGRQDPGGEDEARGSALDWIATLKCDEDSCFFVYDENGTVLAHPDRTVIRKKPVWADRHQRGLAVSLHVGGRQNQRRWRHHLYLALCRPFPAIEEAWLLHLLPAP